MADNVPTFKFRRQKFNIMLGDTAGGNFDGLELTVLHSNKAKESFNDLDI
jgi:hypothetical protein